MSIRLSKAIKECNVGLQTAVDFLNKKGSGEVEANLNTKISDEQYELLLKEFKPDSVLKDAANHMLQQQKEEKERKEKEKAEAKAKAKTEAEAKAKAEEEAKAKAEEEAKAKKQALKVVGHIDLDAPKKKAEPAAEENELEADMQTIDALKAEIERLKEQIEKLEELKRAQNRILAEIGDFVSLFPEIPIEEIPDTVWESVKQGAPLAASYALYEKRMVAEAKRIAEINAKNAKKSPGAAGKDTAGEYFSPEDVRRMSRAEVHANYSKIKDSMKKWM